MRAGCSACCVITIKGLYLSYLAALPMLESLASFYLFICLSLRKPFLLSHLLGSQGEFSQNQSRMYGVTDWIFYKTSLKCSPMVFLCICDFRTIHC